VLPGAGGKTYAPTLTTRFGAKLAARAGRRGPRCLTRTCTHTNSKYRLPAGISSRHDGRLCRPGPARCAVMPADSGSDGSRTRPYCGYLVRFDGFRIVSGPDQRRQYMVFIARAGTGSSTRAWRPSSGRGGLASTVQVESAGEVQVESAGDVRARKASCRPPWVMARSVMVSRRS